MSFSSFLPDFDSLVALHKENPEALEVLRAQMLRNAIASAQPEHRPALEHILFRIEQARESAATPLEAAAAAARLMMESAGHLQTALNHLQHETAVVQTTLVLGKMRK